MKKFFSVAPILLLFVAVSPLFAADVVPPGEISSFNVTRSGADVVLTWGAVSTNLFGGPESVSTYRIYRATVPSFVPDRVGGTNVIATVSGTTFTDAGAAAGSHYYYLVSAVDAAGNEGNVRSSKVTTPPAATVSFTTTAATVNWSGAGPAPRISGYRIFYGTAPNGYDQVREAGGTAPANISPLNTSITYYFVVVAYDNEGNLTAPSNEVSGQLQSAGGPTEVCGRIATSTTWGVAGSPYIVTCDVSVYADTSPFGSSPPPAILTVEPGVVVKFNAGTGLNIGSGANAGGLIAQGTAASPIIFTANQTFPLPGAWKGITFADGTVASSILDQVAVEFAGTSTGASILSNVGQPTLRNTFIHGSLNYGVRLVNVAAMTLDRLNIADVASSGLRLETSSPTIQSSTIRNAGGSGLSISGPNSSLIMNNVIDHGVFFDSATGNPSLTGNTFERADRPMQVGADDVGELFSANTFSGTGSGTVLQVLGERIQSNATWPSPGFPLLITGTVQVYGDFSTTVTLTIGAGSQLKFSSFTYLQIGSGTNRAALIAQGTSSAPILFTTASATPAAGQWGGIFFDDGADDATSVLDRVTVEYAGTSFASGIRVSGSSPAVRNCTVRNSSGYGIYLSASNSTVENCSISQTGNFGIRVDGGATIVRGNTVSAPTGYGIDVSGSNNSQILNNIVANAIFFDNAGGEPIITGNTFANFDAFPIRVGANDVAELLSSNTIQNATVSGRLEILGEPIETSVTWPLRAFPYVPVGGDITVGNSPASVVTLTLEAGVLMKFNSAIRLVVGTAVNKGALVAVGTTAQPIVFTTNNATPAPGQWYGLYFESQAVGASCLLDHVVVEYAGAAYSANIRVEATAPTIRNSTIRNSSVYGIYNSTGASPTIQGNSFSGNANYDAYFSGATNAQVTGNTFTSAVYFDTAAGSHALTGNTFNSYNNAARNLRVGAHAAGGLSSNTFNGKGSASLAEVLGEILVSDATWGNLGLPYAVISSITVAKDATTAARLTIDPGAALRFNASVGLFIGTTTAKGALVAAGTTAQPILFTTNNATPAPGQWYTIYFDSMSDDAVDLLDHVTVEYGGGGYSANVRIAGSSPTIRNSTIRNSSVYGIYGTSGPSPTIQGNSFSGNANFDVYMSGASGAQVTGNTFTSALYFDTAAGTHAVTGNTFNTYNNAARNLRVGAHAAAGLASNTFNGTGTASQAEVLGETLSADAAWASLGFPYAIVSHVTVAKDATTSATLTISPGAVLRFNASVGLFIGTSTSKGALVAAGTVAQPILFTTNNATPAPGQWYAIYFDSMAVDATSLLDRVTVEYGGGNYSTNVRLVGASPTIRNSIFRNSSVYGIYGTGGASPTIQGNSFTGNGNFDVLMQQSSGAQLTGNTFTSAVQFDTAAGTHAVTGNTFNNYNNAARNLRVGAHAAAGLSTNTFNGTGSASLAELLGETLSVNATWGNLGIPYAIVSSITVAKDATTPSTLTINPGAVLRFNGSVGLFIGTSTLKGALVAAGTTAQPIVFTTNNATPAPGQWYAIYFDSMSDDATGLLDHVTVEYGGGNYSANVRLIGASPTIRNSTIRNGSVYGIYGTSGASPTIQGNNFTGNLNYDTYLSGANSAQVTGNTFTSALFFDTAAGTYAVTGNTFNTYNNAARNLRVGAHAAAGLSSNTFNGTGSASLAEILGETLSADATWGSLGLPYAIISNVVVAKDPGAASTLTINPGAVLRFNGGTGLFIGTTVSKGALVAAGTVSLPILFTANTATPTPGFWTGLYFDSMSVDAIGLLDRVTVEYAGQTYSGNVRLIGASPTIRNSTFRNGIQNGIYGTSSPSPVIQANTFSGNANYDVLMDGGSATVSGNTLAHAVRFESASGTPVVTGNVFNTYVAPFLLRLGADSVTNLAGNAFNGTNATSKIEILGETVSGNHRWQALSVPYASITANIFVSGSFTVPANLTLDPGVVIRFASSTRLVIASGTTQANLIAQGTAASPITFTTDSATPAAGQWQGIYLDNGTAFDTILDYVIVEYAGQSSTAGIWLNRADPPIRNSTVRFSGSYGIASNESSPAILNVAVSNTANYGIWLQTGGTERTPSVTGCTITAPTGYGIYNQGNMTSTITGNTIANGIFYDSALGTPVVQNNILNNYDVFPLRIGADSIAGLTGNTLNGTGAASRIEILSETLTNDASWARLSVPYQVVSGTVVVAKNSTQASTLTLAPGTTIKFAPSTGLQIASGSSQGALVAVGTTALPIVFTTSNATPAPGQWNAVYFDSSTVDATSILQNCTVEFGGTTYGANVVVSSASPTIRNCTMRRSSGHGLSLISAAASVTFNQLIDNVAYGVSLASGATPQLNHNNFTGNTSGAINQTGSNIVDARLNWFGNATGPTVASNPGGTGQAVTTNVAFDPWLGTGFTDNNLFTDLFVSTRTFRPTSLSRFVGQVAQDSSWTLRFFDTGSTVVRTITGSGLGIATSWDGRDGSNNPLIDGAYRFQLDATGNATSQAAAPLIGRVSLDGTFALGEVNVPTHLQTYSVGASVAVSGTAGGTGFTNYSVQFGSGLFPTSFSNVVTSSTAVTNGSLGTWNTSGQQNGLYTVRLLVNNNLTEQTVVNVGTFVLSINTLGLDRTSFSPNGDGSMDEVTASSTLSTSASWTITIVNTSTSATVRTFTGSGQFISQSWDGKLADGTTVAPEGTYRFDLSAVKSGQTVATSSASTILDVTPPTASISAPTAGASVFGDVAISGDAFDPGGNFLNYLLEFGVGSTPLTYTNIIPVRTTPVTAGSLGSWVTNDFTSTEPVANGGYQIRLTVTDRAGNVARATKQVNLDNLVLGGVSASRTILDVGLGQTSTINFSINKPATVSLKIYPETAGEAGALQRSFSGSFPPGSQSFLWDGKGTGGVTLPDEAYIYVLEADAGSGRTDKFAPPGGLSGGAGSGSPDPSYNPYTNDFWSMPYFNSSPGRVTMQVTPTGSPTFDVFTNEPHDAGTFDIEWDGRDTTGAIVTVASSVYFPPPVTLRPNFILIIGNTPRMTRVGSDPYRIFMSYANVSRFGFNLGRDALVTITILPPGVNNPADPSGRRIMTSSPLSAGDYSVMFDPIDPAVANEGTFRFNAEGPYTFVIQAVNTTTGATSMRRGVVNMFR